MVYKNINWLSGVKFQMAKKSSKRSGLKISNIILKRIKENLKVTYHREKWLWTKNGILFLKN